MFSIFIQLRLSSAQDGEAWTACLRGRVPRSRPVTPLFTAGANRPQKLAEAEVQGLPEHPRSSQWSLVSISRGHQKVRVRAAPEGSEEGHCPGKARGGERLRKGVRDHRQEAMVPASLGGRKHGGLNGEERATISRRLENQNDVKRRDDRASSMLCPCRVTVAVYMTLIFLLIFPHPKFRNK